MNKLGAILVTTASEGIFRDGHLAKPRSSEQLHRYTYYNHGVNLGLDDLDFS